MLELSRADYIFQESQRTSLFDRLKFLLTASTLLIAGNLSLMAQTPHGWKGWVLAVPSGCSWVLLGCVFWLTWQMYRGQPYKDPKSIQDYLDWRDARRAELDKAGYVSAEQISSEESLRFVIEDFAGAAAHNRRINLAIQDRMVLAQRLVLWLTLVLAIHGAMFVVLVVMR